MRISFDVDALAQPAHEAKLDADDAVDVAAKPQVDAVFDAIAHDPAAADKLRKVVAILRRAAAKMDAGDNAGAAKLALKALDIDENNAVANHMMALALDHLGHLSKSLEFYERAWRINPNDPGVHHNLAMVAWKLDMLEAAEKFYRIALSLQPGDPDTIINLSGVFRDQAKFAEAIELLRATIYAAPERPALWNALGTVLLEQGDPEQAGTFYGEALRLEPEFGRAWHNMGYARANAGDIEGALEAYENAVPRAKSHLDKVQMTYGRALTRLAAGDFEGGWTDYDARLDPDYSAATLYVIQKPRWDGTGPSVQGQRVLIVGEQGLGDEILFASALPDLVRELGPEGELMIACERRLRPLFQRSFPSAKIGPHATLNREARDIRAVRWIEDWDAVDRWGPMGAILKRYRTKLEDFPSGAGFLKPDPARVEELRAALSALPAGPKIGLCWKSKVMNVKRSKYFSPFQHWRSVLATEGAVFVNMQYGQVADELAHARDDLGVTIHELPGLDLHDDLDGVAAAGLALDLFIGPPNASTNLAAAAGGEIWQIAHRAHWPFHNTDRLPWYPQARAFIPPTFSGWDEVMAEVAGALAEFVQTRAAA